MFHELQALSQRFLTLKNAQYRRYFIQKTPLKTRLSLILGQRGVGKTTTLVQHLLDQVQGAYLDPKILYVQADHFVMGKTTLYEIAEQFQNLGGIWLAIDEIHKYAEWSKELKSIYDTFPGLNLVVSGSSLLEIHKGTHDLARRAVSYYMEGMSFREYLELTCGVLFKSLTLNELTEQHVAYAHEIKNALQKQNRKLLVLFKQYLRTGYYPYYFEINNEAAYWMTVEQNFHATLDSDLASVYPGLTHGSIAKIKKLLIYISSCVPFTPNWESLKNELEMGDTRTVKTYFKYLEDAGLIRSVRSASTKPNLDKPGKIYLNNPNQMFAMTLHEANIGTLRETFFLSMLAPSHDIRLPDTGDFRVEKWLFEVGGKKKSSEQIKGQAHSFLACDDLELGVGNRIPLWMFGFLY